VSGTPTLLVLAGMPGSGKSVLARRLAREREALHLDPDTWFVELGLDPHDHERREVFERLQWDEGLRLLELGLSVIAESAGWRQVSRDRRRLAAARLGVRTELHVLDVPLDERWRRIQERNLDPTAVPITYDQLVGFETSWEPPGEAERAAYDEVRDW
jgi:predicted kinase